MTQQSGGSKVAAVKCSRYSEEAVYSAVKKAVSLSGGLNIKKGQSVLLKPNLLMAAEPEKNVTTHPFIVSAAVRLVLEAGGRPFIGDNSFRSMKKIFDKTGMSAISQKYNVRLSSLDNPVHGEKGFILCKEALDCDLIINLPKLKTHMLTKYTGAVKNLYGLIHGMTKLKHHVSHRDPVRFSQRVLDLYEIFKDKIVINIMDAVEGMEGNGPSGGESKKVGCILASKDGLCLDHAACRIVQLENVPLLKIGDVPDYVLVGDKIQQVRFKAPSTYKRIMALVTFQRHLMDRPYVVPDKCIRCMACYDICPVNAVVKQNSKYPFIRDKKCIRCYCCHEMCPEKAIHLRKGRLRYLVRIKRWFMKT